MYIGNRVLFVLLMFLLNNTVEAAVRDFSIRYQTNTPGDIKIIGNTLTNCSEAVRRLPPPNDRLTWDSGSCTNVQNGGIGTIGGTSYTQSYANNFWRIQNVDQDTNTTTFNSSSSILNLPTGASVLFAGLYWGGDALVADTQILFKTPATGSYLPITSTQTDTAAGILGTDSRYQSFSDVTLLVQSAGSGEYWGADVSVGTGNSDVYAGWSLVVVYNDPSDTFKNLTVYDGFQQVTGTTTVDITLSGFVTPAVGTVSTTLGSVTYEGDLGLTGDFLQLDGASVSDGQNPINDYFNSSISEKGVRVTSKSPDYVNQLGYDIDLYDASGMIANSATSTTLTFGTDGDYYYPGVATLSVDIYVPNLTSTLSKTVTDVNGGDLEPGDLLEYNITFVNSGTDGAIDVVLADPITGPVTYVPNSLFVDINDTNVTAVRGILTDTIGDDAGEFNATSNTIIVRLGREANSTDGGLIPSSVRTTTIFQVQVDADSYGQEISNVATLSYKSQTLGEDFTDSGSAHVVTTVEPAADLSVSKSLITTPPFVPGQSITYAIVVSNAGPSRATDINVTDLPTNLKVTSATGSTSSCTITDPSPAVTTSVVCNIASLDAGNSETITLTATVP